MKTFKDSTGRVENRFEPWDGKGRQGQARNRLAPSLKSETPADNEIRDGRNIFG